MGRDTRDGRSTQRSKGVVLKMRPIPSPASKEAYEMLEKAQSLLEKAMKTCPSCGGKMEKGSCVKSQCVSKAEGKCPSCGGKLDKAGACMMKSSCNSMAKYGTMEKASMAEKDKYCMKRFGKKYSECSDKQKAECDEAHGKVEKGEQHRIQTFGTTPDVSTFHIETGGNTYHQQYNTNNTLLESEAVTNKGATSQSYNLEALGAKTNTHDRAVETHEIDTGMSGRTSV